MDYDRQLKHYIYLIKLHFYDEKVSYLNKQLALDVFDQVGIFDDSSMFSNIVDSAEIANHEDYEKISWLKIAEKYDGIYRQLKRCQTTIMNAHKIENVNRKIALDLAYTQMINLDRAFAVINQEWRNRQIA